MKNNALSFTEQVEISFPSFLKEGASFSLRIYTRVRARWHSGLRFVRTNQRDSRFNPRSRLSI